MRFLECRNICSLHSCINKNFTLLFFVICLYYSNYTHAFRNVCIGFTDLARINVHDSDIFPREEKKWTEGYTMASWTQTGYFVSFVPCNVASLFNRCVITIKCEEMCTFCSFYIFTKLIQAWLVINLLVIESANLWERSFNVIRRIVFVSSLLIVYVSHIIII